ncbi:NAD(P)-dependent oxidoreductase [Halorubraceae archaeon YAN]|nr:NAD(P)-dependent oxidoreductase [Halorubraceae archaeon YAN]
MNVLITGAHGTVGTSLVKSLSKQYSLTLLDRIKPPTDHPHADRETIVADVTDRDAMDTAVSGIDAIVHLAGDPRVTASYDSVERNNVRGTKVTLDAAAENGVRSFVFASSNHAVGRYETEHAPQLYDPSYELTVDHTSPVRPDSDYGASKVAGEAWMRLYAERHSMQCYSLRIGSVRSDPYDHPYGDAERAVSRGETTRGSEEYARLAARMKCTWLSQGDLAHLVACCLEDTTVEYETFYGVSGNEHTWFDLSHARETIGYDPKENGHAWTEPPQ